MEDKEFNEKYEQLKKSKFKQQKLWGWRPLPTISCITIIYISFAVFFILLGILILVFLGQINEIKQSYEFYPSEQNVGCPSSHCVTISIKETMKKPIMIYYELENFSQNYRTYLDSLEKSGECDSDNMDINEDAPHIPCSIMEDYYFHDNFCSWKIIGKEKNVKPKEEEIAYKSDKDKFAKMKHVNDEHFMIWMRPSPFSNPRKLWGKIEQDLEKGEELQICIKMENYVEKTRYIILSTRNVFGGKSIFLGMCYIVFGILCLIASITFIIAFNSFHKKKSK